MYIMILESDKGKRTWIETSDLNLWKKPNLKENIINYDNKHWTVKAIFESGESK